MKEYLFNKNNIIYIICHDQYIYNLALIKYSIYKWAKPIIIKYIDSTFENVIWSKMNELKSEWENKNTVGILPYFCFKYLNLNIVDNIITKKLYLPKNYYHFNNIHSSLFNNNNFNKTWKQILNLFDYKESNDNNCYYFVCTPLLMRKFITWYNDICLNKLINNPNLLDNSNFIIENELTKIWENKYYPIYPFIIERLNKYFFDNLLIEEIYPPKKVNIYIPETQCDSHKVYNETTNNIVTYNVINETTNNIVTYNVINETPNKIVTPPKVNSETPNKIVTSPKVNSETPNKIVTSPKVNSETPDKIVTSPKVNSETPDKIVKVINEAPNKIVIPPKVTSEIPNKIFKVISETPNKIVTPPKVTSEAPNKIVTPPKVTSEAPNKIVTPPKVTSETPNKIVTPPKVTSEAPNKIVTPPKVTSEAPNKIVTPPKVTSEAPNKIVTPLKTQNKIDLSNKVLQNINNTISKIINETINNMNTSKVETKNNEMINSKENFRVICNDYIKYIKNISLPIINKNCKYEAILIDYNCFPHIEFIIRNNIIKLGNQWSHTIICGNLNYDFIVKLCSTISNNIKIIKTNYNNINQITYKNLIASNSFLKLFNAQKILLYQEDSCLFKFQLQKSRINNNINTFNLSNKTIYNSNSFWLYNNIWKNLLLTQTILTFKLYKYSFNEHRGGWGTIINNLSKNKIINNTSSNLFLDIIEKYFLWEKNKVIKKKWSGIIHCTPITPPYLKSVNISFLFTNKIFIESLDTCYCIFTLSKYITKFLEKEFIKINKNIKVFTLKHPIETTGIIYFELEKYFTNSNKKLVQIGQQLRKVTSIYLLPNIEHEKLWLTGTKNFKKCEKLLNNESIYLSVNISKLEMDSIKMYYTNTIEEYDNILSQNIVFVDLFDAAANNTVLECIVRNTPIIIRKIEGVVEYLGENYPLYFTKLDQVNDLLKSEKIIKAHEYLKKMDKTDISIDYFIKSLINNLMSLI